jgi:hypothetical protein
MPSKYLHNRTCTTLCSPLDLIRYLRNKLLAQKTSDLIPWVRGFKGKVSVSLLTLTSPFLLFQITKEDGADNSYLTMGIIKLLSKYCADNCAPNSCSFYYYNFFYCRSEAKCTLEISELPLGEATESYKEFLMGLIQPSSAKADSQVVYLRSVCFKFILRSG